MRLGKAVELFMGSILPLAGKAHSASPPKKRKATVTKLNIKSDLSNFRAFAGDSKILSKIDEDFIQDYLSKQKTRATAYRRLYSIRKFFAFLKEKGFLEQPPNLPSTLLPKLTKLPVQTKRCSEELPTDAEVAALLRVSEITSQVQTNYEADVRDYFIMTLLLSGLKTEEVIGLTKEEIIVEPGAKAFKYNNRQIPISMRCDREKFVMTWEAILRRAPKDTDDDKDKSILPYNRNSFNRWFSTKCLAAKVRTIYPRDFRRLAMMDLKADGRSIQEIAEILGLNIAYVQRIVC